MKPVISSFGEESSGIHSTLPSRRTVADGASGPSIGEMASDAAPANPPHYLVSASG